MALVPHKITALAETDSEGGGSNVVAGAVVSLYDNEGSAVTLFDNESGANGSTAKSTDSSGQVVVWVTPGEYDEAVNGSTLRKIVVGGNNPTDVTTLSELQMYRPHKTGQSFICQETGRSVYVLQPGGYTAQSGDVTFANGRVGRSVESVLTSARTYNIPSDFATLQDAVDFLYGSIVPTRQGKITLNIENGHNPSSGLYCVGMDLSGYTITSSTTVTLGNVVGNFLHFDGTKAPVIDALFDAVNAANINIGFVYSNVSSGTVMPNAGMLNVTAATPGGSSGDGMILENGSTVNASNSIFRGCNLRNVHVTTGSTCELSGADVSQGAGDTNLWVSRRSRVVADGLTCNNGNGAGITCLRSEVSLTPFSTGDIDVSGNGSDNIYVSDGSTFFMGARNGSIVIASGAGRDNLYVAGGSTVDAEGADLSGAGRFGVGAGGACRVNALNADISGATNIAVNASGVSVVNAENANCQGYGVQGVLAVRGAHVNARAVNARQAGADQATDFVVDDGATISANVSAGGLSQTANVITSNGIIYK